VRPANIEAFTVRVGHAIALGEVHGYMNETGDDEVAGLDRIEAARAEAETRGFKLLALEARLARLRVLLAHGDGGAQAELATLVEQARRAQAERIARLAEAAFKELTEPTTHPQPGR
jgi:hypothetical protein